MSKQSRGSATAFAIVVACILSLAMGSPASASTPGIVSGTVTASGSSAEGIDVSWIVPSTGAFDTVETAVDGTYTLPLPPGTSHYYLAVNAQAPYSERVNPAYLALFYGQDNTEGYAFQALPAHSTRASYSLDVSLETGASVTGTSADLANSHINLVPVDDDTDSGPYADASGNFSFTGYTPGLYQLYAPSHGVFAAYRSAPFTLDDGQTLDIDPTMSVGGSIEGTITAAIPLRDVTITVTGGDIIGDDPIMTTPDDSGHYAITGLSVGTYTVTVGNTVGGGTDNFVQQAFMEHVVLGETVTHDVALVQGATINLTVPASDPSTSFEFCLYDSNGVLVNDSIRTGGSFSFDAVAPGNYTLDVVDDPTTGYVSEPLTVTAGQSLTLPAPSLTTKAITVSGKVSGGHSGSIEFGQGSATSVFSFGSQASFGTNGKYKATGLLPGKYDVYVFSTGHQRMHYTTTITTSKTANYSIGPSLVPVRGTLELEGAVVGSAGLYFFNSSQDELVMTVSAGKFAASGQAGTYTLTPEIASFNTPEDSFQENSPFYLIWPPALSTFKLTTGHTTNLGTQVLKVGGVG